MKLKMRSPLVAISRFIQDKGIAPSISAYVPTAKQVIALGCLEESKWDNSGGFKMSFTLDGKTANVILRDLLG